MITIAIYLSLISAVGLAFVNYAFNRVFARRDPAESRFYLLVSLGWSANVAYLAYAATLKNPHHPSAVQHSLIALLNVATYILFISAAKWQMGQQWARYAPPAAEWGVLLLTVLASLRALLFRLHAQVLDLLPLVVGIVAIVSIAANYKMHLDNASFRVSRTTRIALVYSMYGYGGIQLFAFLLPPYTSGELLPWVPYVLGAACKGLHVVGMMLYGEHLIAEYERDAKRLRERAKELAHAQNAKRMVSLLAHELNGELLQLRLITEAHAKGSERSEDTKNHSILPLIEHVSNVIKGFLLWYRETDPRSQQGVATVVNANHVCDAAVLGVKIFLRKGDKIRRHYESNTRINAVETEVYQAVRNVIKNAVEAVEARWAGTKGVGLVVVETQSIADEDIPTVRIIVDDNGPGIPEKLRSSIFRDGFSTKEADGRGHGLAVAKHIVNYWNGRIMVEDSPLGGARFVLTFPHADASGAES